MFHRTFIGLIVSVVASSAAPVQPTARAAPPGVPGTYVLLWRKAPKIRDQRAEGRHHPRQQGDDVPGNHRRSRLLQVRQFLFRACQAAREGRGGAQRSASHGINQVSDLSLQFGSSRVGGIRHPTYPQVGDSARRATGRSSGVSERAR